MMNHDIQWESSLLSPEQAAEAFLLGLKTMGEVLLAQSDLEYLGNAIASAIADPLGEEALQGLLSAWKKFQGEPWNYALILEFSPYGGWTLASGPMEVSPVLSSQSGEERVSRGGEVYVQDHGNVEDALRCIYMLGGGGFSGPPLSWDLTTKGRRALRAYCKKMRTPFPF